MILKGKVLSVGQHERDGEVAHGVFVEVPKRQLSESGIGVLYRDVVVIPDVNGDGLTDPHAIVARAIQGARPHRSTQAPRWVAVQAVFGYGSTTSRELCRRYGFDPDEIVPGIQCHCEED